MRCSRHITIGSLVFLLLGVSLGPAWAQSEEEPPPKAAPEGEPPRAQSRAEALASLFKAVQAKEGEVERIRRELASAKDQVTKDSLSEDLAKELDQLQKIEAKFEETAVGVDTSQFKEKEATPFSWEQTLGRVLEPIVAEIEEATATSRKMATLKNERERFGEQAGVASEALENLAEAAEQAPKGDRRLRRALQALIKRWEQRQSLAENQANAADLRLQEIESQQVGFTDYGRKFLSTRGLHLLWGIGAALLVFFGVRIVFSLLRERKKTIPGLRTRLVSVLASILSVLGAVSALLIVFSAAGDLFLVGVVLIFLFGAGWAGIRVLPEFIESLRIILNIGMVKEGERIVFDDVSWRVQNLGFTCYLANERLDGAVLKLPVKRLVGYHSRPFCRDEEVFPTRRGDWVALDDGVTGQVVVQNPDHLILEELGGAQRTYGTPAFLGLSPRKLTSESFQIRTTFGIDYAHQKIATGEVTRWFQDALERALPQVVDSEALQRVKVSFASAAASSLDYAIEVDLAGSAAPLHREVQFALQRILVDACNEHELGIPFQQITVHQA